LGVVIRGVQPAEEVALDEPAGGAADRLAPLEAVFREHYRRIVGMLSRLTGDPGRAEDIAAEVFCKLARRPALYRFRNDPAAWMYRVAANAALDALRVAARRRRNEAAAGVETLRTAATESALEDLLSAERQARVREALAALKPRDAQLLLLRSGDLSYREIAAALGVAAGSVGTLLARAEAGFEREYRSRYGGEL
jgi:RNA polymerase sigma-70 factor (ECF subfamily)